MARYNENVETDYETDDVGEIVLTGSRLVEGVRDWLLTQVKQAHLQKPWNKLSEAEQRFTIERVTDRAERLVHDVVHHVIDGDQPTIRATFESVTLKAGMVKLVAKGVADNAILAILNDAEGKAVSITVMNAEQYDEGRDEIHPDPDQPGLPGVKLNAEPGFTDVIAPAVNEPAPEGEPENDELLIKAVELVREQGKVSVSFIQNHLSIGYNRASVLITKMERDGVITTPDANGNRTVVPTAAQAMEAAELEAGAAVLDRAGKPEAWGGGWESYEAVYTLADNPFAKGSVQYADWAAGWIAAEKAGAPRTEPAPAVEAKTKRTRKPKVVEPAPEPATEPAPPAEDPTGGVGTVTDNNGADIENAEDAFAYGKWCRQDGRGTGSNPFGMASEYGLAWINGYNEAKKDELAAAEF